MELQTTLDLNLTGVFKFNTTLNWIEPYIYTTILCICFKIISVYFHITYIKNEKEKSRNRDWSFGNIIYM